MEMPNGTWPEAFLAVHAQIGRTIRVGCAMQCIIMAPGRERVALKGCHTEAAAAAIIASQTACHHKGYRKERLPLESP